jgi:hypothetical protein
VIRQTMEHPETYVVRVEGRIDEHWAGTFEGLTIMIETSDTGTALTTITGKFVDQAALFGLLRNLYNFRLPLVSVNRVE